MEHNPTRCQGLSDNAIHILHLCDDTIGQWCFNPVEALARAYQDEPDFVSHVGLLRTGRDLSDVDIARLTGSHSALVDCGPLRPGTVLRIRRMLAAQPCDLVHTHGPFAAAYGRLLCGGKPIILGIYEQNEEASLRGSVLRALWRRQLRRARGQVAASMALLEHLHARRLASETTAVVYPSCPAPEGIQRSVSRRALHVPDSGLLVVIPGPYGGGDDMEVLFEGIASVPDCVGLVLGADPCLKLLRVQAQRAGVPVHWVEDCRDPGSYLRVADAVAIPPHAGMTPAVAAAFAYGKPVLAFAGSEGAELVAHGETGMVVPEGTPKAAQQALLAIREPAKRSALGREAYAHWRDRLSPPALKAALSPVYGRLLKPLSTD